MAGAIQFSSPLQDSEWDAAAATLPNASVFHGAGWARVLSETYGHIPMYYTLKDRGRLHALLPLMEVSSALTGRRGVSLPFTDECQPLGFSSDQFQDLLQGLIEMGSRQRWKYVECRGGRELAGKLPVSTSYLGHVLHLDSNEKVLLARFDGSVRRAIRKAKDGGVQIQITQSLEAVRSYYDLHCQTRKRHGLPPQPWSFFSNIHQHLVSKDCGFVSLALHENIPIAGAVFLVFGRRGLYKFSASSHRSQHLRGNNLLIWEAIKWLGANRFEQLDFGRTAPSNQGLRRFKLGWSAAERSIDYFRYDFRHSAFVGDSGIDRDRRWYNAIFRHTPAAFSRWAGALLYRHQS